jgi:RimJ/RimL family protein N-acetyltransferase
LREFLSQLTHRRLTARVSANNAASIRMLEKCGFQIAGSDEFSSEEGKAMKELIFTVNHQYPCSVD